MATNFWGGVLAVIAFLLVGCTSKIEESRLLEQVDDIFSRNQIGCAVVAEYKGVGEGDSDTAYATIELLRKEGGKSKARVDVELMISHQGNRDWLITDESAKQLITAAEALCVD